MDAGCFVVCVGWFSVVCYSCLFVWFCLVLWCDIWCVWYLLWCVWWFGGVGLSLVLCWFIVVFAFGVVGSGVSGVIAV